MFYNYIKQRIEQGLYVVVINDENKYRVFHRVVSNGSLEATGSEDTIEDSLISSSHIWNEYEINGHGQSFGWRIHSLMPRPITPYPVGTKVRISETIKELKNAHDSLKVAAYEKKILEIKYVFQLADGKLLYEFSMDTMVHGVDHRFLIPVLEEDENVSKEEWLEEYYKII